MAVTPFQSEILRLIAHRRIEEGETYIAGGLALNHQLRRPRVSSDIDIFNSTQEALRVSSEMDCKVLNEAGYQLNVVRNLDFMVEVLVSRGNDTTDLQWVRDSAYRFFPLVEDDLLGLTLHPFDLATNKLLALSGREVPRDWVDTITCSEQIQPLGLLAWAANGKDLGLTPLFILEMAMRTRYSQAEFDVAIVNHADYDLGELSRTWNKMIRRARETVALLPADQVGKAVLNLDGTLFFGSNDELLAALKGDKVAFHEGCIGGAWPRIIA